VRSLRQLTRKQIEEALKEAEEQFAKVFRASPLVVTLTSARNARYIEVNEAFERTTGWRRDEVIGRTPYDLGIWVDPGQRVDLVERLLSGATVRNLEVRVRMRNGENRIGLGSMELIDIEGEQCVLSAAVHVTERKLGEESPAKAAQRLIEAQEGERARFARELHDNIDSLVLLSIYLDRFQQNPRESITESGLEIGGVRQELKDVVSGFLDLSHRLYPSKLEYLGLAVAAASYCNQLSDGQDVKIDFQCQGVPKELPNEIALCLYRVMQEALENAIKHSGSRLFEVSLCGQSTELQLTVRDWGVGFDPAVVMTGRGLGLTTMKERLKLVDGEFSIESQPQHGTSIHARVILKT
jgi:PAS domain S-box-containing protein